MEFIQIILKLFWFSEINNQFFGFFFARIMMFLIANGSMHSIGTIYYRLLADDVNLSRELFG
jgi:hypothetical protein